MSVGSAFVHAFVQDDKYKQLMTNGNNQQATFMKAPYEISSAARSAGILRKPAIFSAGVGQMLDERAKQEEQVHANAANNTGSPYVANSFVDSYLRHSNMQQARLEQRRKSRFTGARYMSVPFILVALIAFIVIFRKLK